MVTCVPGRQIWAGGADKCGMFEFYQGKSDEDAFWCLYLWKNKDRKFGFDSVRGEFSTEFMHKWC